MRLTGNLSLRLSSYVIILSGGQIGKGAKVNEKRVESWLVMRWAATLKEWEGWDY